VPSDFSQCQWSVSVSVEAGGRIQKSECETSNSEFETRIPDAPTRRYPAPEPQTRNPEPERPTPESVASMARFAPEPFL
jgi:hypothetical protein